MPHGPAGLGADATIFRPAEPVVERLHGTVSTLGVPRFTLTAEDGFSVRAWAIRLPCAGRQFELPPAQLPGGVDLAGEGRLAWPAIRARKSGPSRDRRSVTGAACTLRCDMARDHNYTWPATTCALAVRCGSNSSPAPNASPRPVGRMYTHLADACRRRDLRQHEPWRRGGAGDRHRAAAVDRTLSSRKKGDLNLRATHFYRDLTPCLYDRGRLIVAPADSESVLAYDAATGLLLWETSLAKDVVHLLGVGGDALWASGEKLWHINVATGKVSYPWPEGPTPKGFGRGVLAGGKVYWPTVSAIHVFDQRTGQEQAADSARSARASLRQSHRGR